MKIRKKYSEYTKVEIIENNNCSPEYLVRSPYPFYLDKSATCKCAEIGKLYSYSVKVIEPAGVEHNYDFDYFKFRVLKDYTLGAAGGMYKASDNLTLTSHKDGIELNQKGLYTIIETIKVDDCGYKAKYTFYHDPNQFDKNGRTWL